VHPTCTSVRTQAAVSMQNLYVTTSMTAETGLMKRTVVSDIYNISLFILVHKNEHKLQVQ